MSRCPRGTLGLGGSLKEEGSFNSDVVCFFSKKTFSVLGLVGWGVVVRVSHAKKFTHSPFRQVPFRAYPPDFQKSIVVVGPKNVGLKIDKSPELKLTPKQLSRNKCRSLEVTSVVNFS